MTPTQQQKESKMTTEYKLFHKGNEEWSGSKESCKRIKKSLIKKYSWIASDFKIQDGFEKRESFNLYL